MTYLLLIFIYLKSGMLEVKHSIVYDTQGRGISVCNEYRPLYEKLYLNGQFGDGPPKELVKEIRTRCEPVENNLAVY